MASVVRLAVGTLSTIAHQAAATFCSTPLRLLSVPRQAAAHSSRYGIPTSNTRHASVMARSSSLLSAVSSTSPSPTPMRTVLQNAQVCAPINMQSCRSYHVRVALKKRCSSCYFVRRKGRLYVECKAKPRHKQMQVMSKHKTWKEDYSEGNIKGAIYWKYHRDHGYYRLGNTPFVRHDWLKGKIGVTV